MMLKVIIADDEKNICLMIKKLIDWENLGMTVVAIAHNAIEAYDYIEMYQPDIVISDIRMPGFDGLELVQRTIDDGRAIHFIIISGYKYFEYAHKALKLGVEHYLLKPIDKVELEEALDKIRLSTEDNVQKLEEEVLLKEEVSNYRKKMKKHFLTTIIRAEESARVKGMEMQEINEAFQCDFHAGIFQAIFVKIDYMQEEGTDIGSLLHMVDTTIEKILQNSGIEYINCPMKSGVICVFNYSQENSLDETLQKIRKRIQFELDKFHEFYVTIGVGGKKFQIQEVSESIEGAVKAIKSRVKAGLQKILYWEELKYQQIEVKQVYGERERRTNENIVEALDAFGCNDFLNVLVQQIREIPFYSPVVLFEVFEEVLETMLCVLKKNKVSEETLEMVETKVAGILDGSMKEEKLIARFRESVVEEIARIREEKKNQSQLPIRQAKQYIQEHYAKPISLEDVAEAIHLSGAYLSTMFKKEIGINFSDYLTTCRIEAAKELLKKTELSIAVVAEQVGYVDARYFSKIFHKVVGLKPSAYRKLYS